MDLSSNLGKQHRVLRTGDRKESRDSLAEKSCDAKNLVSVSATFGREHLAASEEDCYRGIRSEKTRERASVKEVLATPGLTP